MQQQEKKSILCPEGIKDSWAKFPWGQYRGVEVTVAAISDTVLWLLRPTKWNYELLRVGLEQGETLQDAIGKFHGQLGAKGIRVTASGRAPASVVEAEEIGGTFHVLLFYPISQIGPSKAVERVDNALMLGGYAVSNPMAKYVPRFLQWADAHLMDQPARLAA